MYLIIKSIATNYDGPCGETVGRRQVKVSPARREGMDVGLVGDGPAIRAVTGVLGELGVEPVETTAAALDEVDIAVVRAGRHPGETLARANRASLVGETPWLAIEREAVGGHAHPDVAVSLAGFEPESTGCWACLESRVAAGSGTATDDGTDGFPAGTERLAGTLAGRELARLLTGGASTLLGGVVVVPGRETRELLPVPGCVCQHPPEMFQLDHRRPDTPEQVLDSAGVAVDGFVGPIESLQGLGPRPLAAECARLAPAPFGDDEPHEPVVAAGPDRTSAAARVLERSLAQYCRAVGPGRGPIRGTADELPLSVEPDRLVAPVARDDGEMAWALGRRLADGTPGHVPAARVYGGPGQGRGTGVVCLGAGSSTARAMLDGLYTALEHDATMLSWYSSARPPELSLSGDRFERLRGRAAAEGLTVTPLLVAEEPVPVVAVALEGPGWPQFTVGSAANLDPARATRAALCEAGALRLWLESAGEDAVDGRLERYAGAPEPVRTFASPDRTVAADSVGPETVPEGLSEYLAVVERAEQIGEPYGVRLTTPDVEGLGIEVGAVVVPGAQPRFETEPSFGERARNPEETEPQLDRAPQPYPPYRSVRT
jgi:ribosomal protein S12 methylthiotransferase accessory factor